MVSLSEMESYGGQPNRWDRLVPGRFRRRNGDGCGVSGVSVEDMVMRLCVCINIKREMNCCCGEEKKIHESVLSPDTHTIRNIKRVEKQVHQNFLGVM